MQKSIMSRLGAVALAAILAISLTTIVSAAPVDIGVTMKSPASSAAVVATMPGFQDVRYKTCIKKVAVEPTVRRNLFSVEPLFCAGDVERRVAGQRLAEQIALIIVAVAFG